MYICETFLIKRHNYKTDGTFLAFFTRNGSIYSFKDNIAINSNKEMIVSVGWFSHSKIYLLVYLLIQHYLSGAYNVVGIGIHQWTQEILS